MPASQVGRRVFSLPLPAALSCRPVALAAAALTLVCATGTGLSQDNKGTQPTRPVPTRPGSGVPAPTPPRTAGGQPAGAQPSGARGGTEMARQMKPAEAGIKDGEKYQFGPYSEPIELTELIELVRQDFELELLYTDSGLKGQSVVINTAVTLPQDQVLPFVLTLLEQKDYTIVRDASGVHMVQPKNTVLANIGQGILSPTKIIRTPGLKPSSLQGLIASLLAKGGAQASVPVFLDDLGVIVMTDTPRNTRLVEEAVASVIRERELHRFMRYEIHNIAASSARERIFELLGSGVTRGAVGAQGGQPGQAAAAGLAGVLTNLPERLSVDPGSNALFFRGRDDEGQLLADLLALVDVPITLVSRFYSVGSETAETVATEGSRQLLGEVTTFQSADGGLASRAGLSTRPAGAPGAPGQAQQTALSGSGFVIYPRAGGFIYRGTEAQHARVDALVRELGDLIDNDTPITQFYKLKHQKAADVAETINSLLSGQSRQGGANAPLLGRDLGQGRRDPFNQNRARTTAPRAADQAGADAAVGEAVGDLTSDDVFVLADEKNNQVLVKAPKRLQPQMKSLISQLDLLRPQVYIEAKIVTVTIGDDFRFAAEVQQIIGQFALNTNFGLGSIGAGGTLQDPKNPATNLAGLTTALIRSKDVPFIINTIQRNNEARVVATPQLLVADNEEAEVSSLDQQPTSTISLGTGGNTDRLGFSGYEPAGPKMRIKPQVSDAGSVKLEYEIEISSFTGDASADGSPPPKREDKVRADSVTVPSDSTIVVGGLVFESVTEADSGIPFLKDIPGIGMLFKDMRKTSRKTLLYVFVTPRVMRDTSFNDLRILSKGPMAAAKINAEIPDAEPLRMEILDQHIRREPTPDSGSLRRPRPATRVYWDAD